MVDGTRTIHMVRTNGSVERPARALRALTSHGLQCPLVRLSKGEVLFNHNLHHKKHLGSSLACRVLDCAHRSYRPRFAMGPLDAP